MFHTASENELVTGAYCLKGTCACPGGEDALPKLGQQGTLAIYGDGKPGVVKFRISSVKEGCPKDDTTLNIAGAQNTTLTRNGSCSEFRFGFDGDIQVIFFELLNDVSYQVTLELDAFNGPGTYEAPPSVVTVAAASTAYSTFVRDEPPTYPSSGVINVTSASSSGMKGNVTATTRGAGGSQVTVTGNWTCARP